MSATKQILHEFRKRADVGEFLQKELSRAGYGGVEIVKSPLGTRVTIYAVRPGIVIGRGGEMIRTLSRTLEAKFKLFNPQIAVAEVDVPELNPNIMASKVVSALERGIHFRRACYWALNGIMGAGARGCEIKISGKLTTERSRTEKFREGYVPKVGDTVMKNARKAVVSTQLKPGLLGVKVVIIPPDYRSPDQINLKESISTEEKLAEVSVPTSEAAPEATAAESVSEPSSETEGETKIETTTPEATKTAPLKEAKGEELPKAKESVNVPKKPDEAELKPEKPKGETATPTPKPGEKAEESKEDAKSEDS